MAPSNKSKKNRKQKKNSPVETFVRYEFSDDESSVEDELLAGGPIFSQRSSQEEDDDDDDNNNDDTTTKEASPSSPPAVLSQQDIERKAKISCQAYTGDQVRMCQSLDDLCW